MLCDIFPNYFELKNDFKIDDIVEIKCDKENINPDVIISIKMLQLEISNGYIGISHLCCFGCSILINSFGYDFRGLNTKFEINLQFRLI
jgi:hypothetical protein